MGDVAVTGMAAEAKLARAIGWAALVIGGTPAQREAMVARGIADGATRLISFGIAGGLAPGLAPGALLLPKAVCIESGDTIPVDEKWRAAVAARLGPAEPGLLLGEAAIVASAAAKRALFRSTGAVAADLESGAVARAASRAKIPFLVLRAVADPADRDLPEAALVGLDERGGVALGAVLRSILRRPGQIPALLRVSRDTSRAFRTLRDAGRAAVFTPV